MDRRLRRGEVIAALSAAIRRRTSDEMVAASAAAKVNVAKINTVGRAAQDPQLQAIGGVVELARERRALSRVALRSVLQAAPMRMEAVPPVTWKIYAERALSVEACTCGACGASGGGGWGNSIP